MTQNFEKALADLDRLEKLYEENQDQTEFVGGDYFWSHKRTIKSALSAAIAAQNVAGVDELKEAIAWWDHELSDPEGESEIPHIHVLLEAARLHAQSRQAVPEGWKLVPVEPTWEMAKNGACYVSADKSAVERGYESKNIYKAMLSAAPDAGEVG